MKQELVISGSDSSAGKRSSDLWLIPSGNSKRSKLSCPTNEEDGNIICRDVALQLGFLDPLTPLERQRMNSSLSLSSSSGVVKTSGCRQFWKAGDYEPVAPHLHNSSNYSGGMDHARVHPKFLHSNATSHKWALGAFAELLDNALDEVSNGATYVSVDMLRNVKDDSKMLVVQDNGGGMNPDKMRQCMSLGYSSKSKLANTIGQYGNGFKTSTMRLGADVIVFSCCEGKDGSPTRTLGMLSYTFLQNTGKEDIVVPMIDYEKDGQDWVRMLRSSSDGWYRNLETIVEWSPYSDEQELLKQFDFIENQGTRIIIYNLWEDDMEQLELDFDTDTEDIQIRGVNRDEKKIAMARKYPNSRHFLTYQNSLRSYASILYLRLPPGFRIILRGKDVEHHNLVEDIILKKEILYKPKIINEGGLKDPDVSPANIQATVTMGFAKDAHDHIDIQGFNVYHKNRLIRPFWRVWNAAGSDGRGVIGVLEANFVEPAHDKQGFERTTALARLEQRLIQMQKDYWRDHCHEVGYAPRRPANKAATTTALSAPIKSKTVKATANGFPKEASTTKPSNNDKPSGYLTGHETVKSNPIESQFHTSNRLESQFPQFHTSNRLESQFPQFHTSNRLESQFPQFHTSSRFESQFPQLQTTSNITSEKTDSGIVAELRKKNLELHKRLQDTAELNNKLKRDLECEKHKLAEAERKIEEMDKEQITLIDMISEERERRGAEEENLQRTIHNLVHKVKTLEATRITVGACKTETY